MLHAPITPPATPTLPNAREALFRGDFNERWTENTRKKLLGSASTAPRVYEALAGVHSPDLVLCDVARLDALCALYLKEKRAPEGCGFKSFKAFHTWWSNMRRLFDVASGARARSEILRAQDDDWSELVAHLSGQRGSPEVLDKVQMIPLLVLSRICREHGVRPRDVSTALLMEIAPDIRPEEKQPVRNACQVLDRLRGRNEIPSGLLPEAPIGDLPALTPPNQRQTPPLGDYAALLHKFVERKRLGLQDVQFGTKSREIQTSELGSHRVQAIEVACRWYWHGVVALGIVDPAEPLTPSILAQPEILHDVVMACAEGKLGGCLDPRTRRKYVHDAIQFLDWVSPGYAAQIDPGFFKATCLSSDPDAPRADEERKRRTCLQFINSAALQRRFFMMPRVFFDEARALIDRFETLKPEGRKGLSRLQHRALDLAIMAANAAIATRYPLRLDTRSKLKSGGLDGERHLFFPGEGTLRDSVILNIPGKIMKNGTFAEGVPLRPSKQVDPRRILLWYLEKAHPLVLKHKPTRSDLRDPRKLFCGLNKKTLGRIWVRYSAEAGCYSTPHTCRHMLASLLYAEGVPIEQIAELLGHKDPTTTLKAYTFVNRVKLVEGAMAAQAKKFRSLGV